MNVKSILFSSAVIAMAGCCSIQDKKCCCECKDPIVGNWGLKLPYDAMNAGSMIIERDAEGKASGLVLWRWASPNPVKNLVIKGNEFSFDHPWKFRIEGKVCGDKLEATVVNNDGTDARKIIGWRNPPITEKVSTKDAKFGEKIDLLKDGLNGWKSMNPESKFAWKFKDGILSNNLGRKPNGEWNHGGANLMTKRSDFYDFKLEYDVRVPKDSNSGVYLRGRYEIQTIDSYGKPVDCHNMAAYYGRVTPSVAAEKPAGEWQHVSVVLYKRHLTVVLNGKTIIENAPVVGITGGAMDANEFVPGPLYLQGDHSDADYKNMYLYPVVK
ncbi:MAG: DUF1080 domain-containing protein [Kiritimatiellae bacterium]|nr:DUF1080 domain-containing protein [Kiritimatiellia bacterium]